MVTPERERRDTLLGGGRASLRQSTGRQRTSNMSRHIHVGKSFTIFLSLILATLALPTSVLQDLMANDVTNKKVKRAQTMPAVEKPLESQKEYFYPTAIKRGGGGLKTNQLPLLTEWDQQRYREQAAAEDLPVSLYSPLDELDDKSVSDYEKGYRYATNRDKLDEALENAILKSELYGEPTALNQYRYYEDDDRKRKRRNASTTAKKAAARTQQARRITNRLKRETDLSPEDILAILTLWENERLSGLNTQNRRPWQPNYESDYSDFSQDSDEDWLDAPVYPHASDEHMTPPSPNYYYDVAPQYAEKRGRWGGFTENRRKRFMVAKKRADPTRELRYLNGPSRNDYYALSEFLANQRDAADGPLYQRY
ncbi:prohormone-2 isoform X1 [Atheta coriaria]|uniref:prohormone-2 isoform X1 n=1 Tax=Dalotia coriaria TaxID=877792 RepID=UPI0031F34E90